jgi:2-iminobutanoate/2-iminopropanoate deaminase
MVFTSGQVYLTSDGKLLEGSIEEQTHQVMRNLKAILEAAGVAFSDVVKTTIYVTDMSAYGKINQVYGSYFSDPFPARETVCVKELPLGARLEISMIAIKHKA